MNWSGGTRTGSLQGPSGCSRTRRLRADLPCGMATLPSV